MKKVALIPTLILISSGFIACTLSPESAFFSKFSIQQLVVKNKASTGLDCEGNGNDRGPGIGGGSFGFGRKEYHSHKGDAFFAS